MARKTVDVSFVRSKANLMLRRDDVSDDYRKGVIRLLESVLHATDNYHGFNYISWVEKEGRDLTGCEQWRADKLAHVAALNTTQAIEGLPFISEDYVPFPTSPYLGNETRRVYYDSPNAPNVPSNADRDAQYPNRLR